LQFSFQVASPETFGYTLVLTLLLPSKIRYHDTVKYCKVTHLSKWRNQNVHDDCREKRTQDRGHCSRPVYHEEEPSEAHRAEEPVEPPGAVVNATSDGESVDIGQENS